jgi:hypothetical protein
VHVIGGAQHRGSCRVAIAMSKTGIKTFKRRQVALEEGLPFKVHAE